MTKARAYVAILAAGLLALGCAGAPRPTALPGPGSTADYVQAASGMVFPASVGSFQRGGITRFASDGTDEAADYERKVTAGEEIKATVYVYRRPQGGMSAQQLCDSEFLGAAQAVAFLNPGAELLGQSDSSLAQSEATYAGRIATLTFSSGEAGFYGAVDAPLRSELHLFCGMGGAWLVKYRFTHRADYDASAEIAAFMRDLTLTLGPQRLGDFVERDAAEDGGRGA
jgi:hypothetical protein